MISQDQKQKDRKRKGDRPMMRFDDLERNVKLMFPEDSNDSNGSYAFFITQALEPFENRPGDLTNVWEEIKTYDGMKRRPSFAFFSGIAAGIKWKGADGFTYYQCSCGEKLSFRSAGGCVKCHKSTAELKTSKDPVKVTRCQQACFDCSIYSDRQMGPSCNDYGTPRYEGCQFKNQCKCRTCCRFEYMRAYHPKDFRSMYQDVLKALPKPNSAAGVANHEDRASFVDINAMLNKIKGNKGVRI